MPDKLISMMWESEVRTHAFASDVLARWLEADRALVAIYNAKDASADDLRKMAMQASRHYRKLSEEKT